MKDETALTFPAIPGLAKKPFKTCGECAFYQPMGADVSGGVCHGNPPGIMFTERGPANIRPGVRVNERACRHWEENE